MALNPMAIGGRGKPGCPTCQGHGVFGSPQRGCPCLTEQQDEKPKSPGELARAAERTRDATKAKLAQDERLLAEALAALPAGACPECYGEKTMLTPGGMVPCPACVRQNCATCQGSGRVKGRAGEYDCPAPGCSARAG
jgi:hypothetical protein